MKATKEKLNRSKIMSAREAAQKTEAKNLTLEKLEAIRKKKLT